MNSQVIATAVFLSVAALSPASVSAAPVQHTQVVVNGVNVDRYQWLDSKNRPRSVSLKKEGGGNPGHGGYAVQMTYQVPNGTSWRTVVVNAAPGEGGFGYFVSHERYRDFTNGANGTIAGVVFRKDDSPLGRNFAVTGARIAHRNPDAAAHRFRLTYPRYGTLSAIPRNADGADSRPVPTDPRASKLYSKPVTVTWVFQDKTDYPLIRTDVSLAGISGPDRVSFDVRGPYGVLDFDGSASIPDKLIDKVFWGDRYHFETLGAPLTRNSAWRWNTANSGARYSALTAGGYEMGLVEPRKWTSSTLVHGFAFERGKTSATYNGGRGCADENPPTQLLPCDWAWPYQSAQYSLSYEDRTEPTSYKKIAWGSTADYGAGPSLPRVWDSTTTSRPFNGFPANRTISYSLCVVLGKTVSGSLTRKVAAGPTYNCATSPP